MLCMRARPVVAPSPSFAPASAFARQLSRARWPSLALLLSTLLACGPTLEDRPEGPVTTPASGGELGETPASAAALGPPDPCPAAGPGPAHLPDVTPEQETLAYWLEVLGARYDLDTPLLTAAEVDRLNRAARTRPHGPAGRIEDDLRTPVSAAALQKMVNDRVSWMRSQATEGKHLEPDGSRMQPERIAAFAVPTGWAPGTSRLRVALGLIALRCGPRIDPVLGTSKDPNFDRNACSAAHAQELVEDFGPFGPGLRLVRTRYALGWIADTAPLSPPLSDADARTLLNAGHLQAQGDTVLVGDDGARFTLPDGRFVAAEPTSGGAASSRLVFADATGLHRGNIPASLRPTDRPLTRKAVLEEAFRWLNAPYGWGGQGGGRDCSRYLLDLFAVFGIELPRHSAHQPQVASFVVDVSGVKAERDRLALLDAAAKQGVVLMHFPGHIMLYLGRDRDGRPMAIHSFAEYLVPCPAEVVTANKAHETLLTVNRVTVSDLELGRGSSRTAFIERLTHIAVLGPGPGPLLEGAATLRPAAPVTLTESTPCRAHKDFPVFVSPERPLAGQPVRIIGVPFEHPGPLEAAVRGPDGTVEAATLRSLGGPPYGRVLTIEAPRAGTYTVALGDGDRVASCRKFRVESGNARPDPAPASGAWTLHEAWGPQTERLFALFVESLFDYPPEDERTWNNLHTLLADPTRNLLFDHRELGEDARVRLQPDCADLPYFLRAYFAWKLGLPMAWRECSRGRDNRAPRCGPIKSQAEATPRADGFESATYLIRRGVKSGVHSSTARTVPDDDETDTYPIPLTREALRPGTTYADPYGHLLVLTRWVPQTATSPGVLMAADAQPDGTIGRRRFWQGSFLFSSETKYVGAGFKAFRPVVMRDGAATQLTNAELRESTSFVPWSDDQYRHGDAGFYDRVEAIANPRPLDPFARQQALADALAEVVQRRASAIQTGEDFMKARRYAPISMPSGADIFLTSGPWEDFATPSRDLRLLVSIHTFLDFPASVRRGPERFGIEKSEVDSVVARLEAAGAEHLRSRRVQYNRTDGSAFELDLRAVVDRRTVLEVAYNPNDCPEVRWGAPEGSPERAPCNRTSPADQVRKMAQYRGWFRDRRRPAR